MLVLNLYVESKVFVPLALDFEVIAVPQAFL